MTRAQAFAEYWRLLALEEGGVVWPDASIPVVAETIEGMRESVERFLQRFGLDEMWASGAKALVEEGRSTAASGPSSEQIRQALFQGFVFRLMWDLHGIDLGDFHEVPAIPETLLRVRAHIEEWIAPALAQTAAVVRKLRDEDARSSPEVTPEIHADLLRRLASAEDYRAVIVLAGCAIETLLLTGPQLCGVLREAKGKAAAPQVGLLDRFLREFFDGNAGGPTSEDLRRAYESPGSV